MKEQKHKSLHLLREDEEPKQLPKAKVRVDLLEIHRISQETARKIARLDKIKESLYEALALKAQEVYAPQIQGLVEQVEHLLVTDQELRELEIEVLNELKRVLAKY